ncbi:UNVERIFIED_CONTAM: hypothetical protein K2H54_006266 [Gekko kuhli]
MTGRGLQGVLWTSPFKGMMTPPSPVCVKEGMAVGSSTIPSIPIPSVEPGIPDQNPTEQPKQKLQVEFPCNFLQGMVVTRAKVEQMLTQ